MRIWLWLCGAGANCGDCLPDQGILGTGAVQTLRFREERNKGLHTEANHCVLRSRLFRGIGRRQRKMGALGLIATDGW